MKEINGTSLEELETLYKALLEGEEDCEPIESISSLMVQAEIEDYLHQVTEVCSLEDFLKAFTSFQKVGLLEEFEGLEEGEFDDSSFFSQVKERLLSKEHIFLRLTHCNQSARDSFRALITPHPSVSTLSPPEVQSLLIFLKVGFVCCYQEGSTYQAFVPEEVKEVYHTLVPQAIEEKAAQVQYWYDFSRAAVNLYGILSMNELVGIYGTYHQDQKDVFWVREQFERTLLEYIPSLFEIELWEDCVMTEFLVGDTGSREQLLQDQQGKPRYLPEHLEEFLRYKDETYVRPYMEQKAMKSFFEEQFPQEEPENLDELMLSLSYEQKFSIPSIRTFRTIDEMGFMPSTKKAQEEMLDYLIPMDGHARKWEHKGFSSNEILTLNPERIPAIVPDAPSITPKEGTPSKNGSCPCGSGKKYKRCCMK